MLDSFISYLAGRLNGTLPVNYCRVTETDATSDVLKKDFLNISSIDSNRTGQTEEFLVSLDILTADERRAWAWADAVNTELLAERFCPETDYVTDPAGNPLSTGRAVFWDRDGLGFALINRKTGYVHLNATFPIKHVLA